jgi:hypothetical protein
VKIGDIREIYCDPFKEETDITAIANQRIISPR